jgi:hypothetical protein
MSVIVASDLNAVLDPCVRFALRYVGTQASGYGVGVSGGVWGAVGAITDLKTVLVTTISDLDPIAALVQPIQTLDLSVNGVGQAANNLAPILSALQGHVTRFQVPNVRSLDDYLTYLNVSQATKWQALQHPYWRDLASSWQTGVYPSAWNLYFEVLQGATYANGLAKFVVGTGYSVGQTIDTSMYAGGFPQLKASGITGTGLVTVTGTAYDPATKTATAGMTWTATVNANGVFTLVPGGATPAPANSLIGAVSAISAAVGITAGSIYVEAARPAGRPLLP